MLLQAHWLTDDSAYYNKSMFTVIPSILMFITIIKKSMFIAITMKSIFIAITKNQYLLQ
jgi:hypothetical protein